MKSALIASGVLGASAALISSNHDAEKSAVDSRLRQTKGLYELVRSGSHTEDSAEFDKKYADIRKQVRSMPILGNRLEKWAVLGGYGGK